MREKGKVQMKGKGLQEDFLLHYNLNNKAYD